MPLSNRAKDGYAAQWSPSHPSVKPQNTPVDYADEFENITAWWWNPDAVSSSNQLEAPSNEAKGDQAIDLSCIARENRWKGQALGVYRRQVTRAMREIFSERGFISGYVSDEGLNEVYVNLAQPLRVEVNQKVHEVVEQKLAALTAWLPEIPANWEGELGEGQGLQKRLVFAGPDRQYLDEWTETLEMSYDRLQISYYPGPAATNVEDRFYLDHYNKMLQAAYEQSLLEIGLDPASRNDEGVPRRQEVKDVEANIYEICRSTYAKLDESPLTAALALALGQALI